MKLPSTFSGQRNSEWAFTLLEVMIAVAIFFMAVFAILGLVTRNLRAAHSLTQYGPTAGMLAAELSSTNSLTEGSESGDFGEIYPNYNWTRDVVLYATNGLYQVDFTVYKDSDVDSILSVLMFRPDTGVSQGGVRRIFPR